MVFFYFGKDNYVTPHIKKNMRQWNEPLDVNFLIRTPVSTIQVFVDAISFFEMPRAEKKIIHPRRRSVLLLLTLETK